VSPATEIDLRPLAGVMRRDLRRFDLTLRELLLALAIVELTFELNRAEIWIPRLEEMSSLTGISRGDISRGLGSLTRQRIIQKQERDGGADVRPLPDAFYWQARPRTQVIDVNAARESILAANGIEQLLLRFVEPGLTEALHQVSVEGANGSRVPADRCQFNNGESVVNLTTALPAERCQFDNDAKNSMFTGVSCANTKLAPFPPTPPLYSSERVLESESSTRVLLGSEALPGTRLLASAKVESLMEACREVLGAAEMDLNTGLWLIRAREAPETLERVLAETKVMVREGRIWNSPAAAATDLWKRWRLTA
jgi:hypothetical protein